MKLSVITLIFATQALATVLVAFDATETEPDVLALLKAVLESNVPETHLEMRRYQKRSGKRTGVRQTFCNAASNLVSAPQAALISELAQLVFQSKQHYTSVIVLSKNRIYTNLIAEWKAANLIPEGLFMHAGIGPDIERIVTERLSIIE